MKVQETSDPTESNTVINDGGTGDRDALVGDSTSSIFGDTAFAESNKGCGYLFCDPRSNLHRFIALIFMCLVGFGSTFCYDNPAALQDMFTADMKLSTADFAQLYSWYSWPNVICCFIGGFLIDSVFGVRLGTIIFCFLLLVGQIIFAFGGIFDTFWLMLVGRFIFGIGGESLAVSQNTYAVSWFKGKELNMVFGLQLSFSRVGSAVNFHAVEPVYHWVENYLHGYYCLGVVLIIASLTCVASLLSSIILGVFDYRAERILNKKTEQHDPVRFSDIKDFPISFWLTTAIVVAYYISLFPFIALGKVFFVRKFDMTPDTANSVNSIVYLISAFASPLFGHVVDRTGRNIFWVFISLITTAVAHGLLAFTFVTPYYATVLMGLAYSMLASALWPIVALVVPEHQLGTAYGIVQAAQNLFLALMSMACGYIVDFGGYLLLEVFFLSWVGLALAFTMVLWFFNSFQNGILNMSIGQREQWEHSKMLMETLERDELMNSAVPSVSNSTPSSDFHIRNRYLSRIGATLPPSYEPRRRALVYRTIR